MNKTEIIVITSLVHIWKLETVTQEQSKFMVVHCIKKLELCWWPRG